MTERGPRRNGERKKIEKVAPISFEEELAALLMNNPDLAKEMENIRPKAPHISMTTESNSVLSVPPAITQEEIDTLLR